MGFDLCGLAPSHAMRLRPLTALARKAPPWGVAGRAPTDWRPRALRVRCASAAKQQGAVDRSLGDMLFGKKRGIS